MKKAMFVVWGLSFCSVSVWGMPPDRRGSDAIPLLGEYQDDFVANPSAKSEGCSTRKRKLSQSSDEDREIRMRCGESFDVADQWVLISSDEEESDQEKDKKIDGLRKRIGVKEEKLMIVSTFLDSLMKSYTKLVKVDPKFVDLYYSFGTDIGEKAGLLLPMIISKVSELQDKNAKNEQEISMLNKRLNAGVAEVQKLQGRDSEKEAEIKELRGQIDQLKQILQNQKNGVVQSEMNVSGRGSGVILTGNANDFHVQGQVFGSRDVETPLRESNGGQDVVMVESGNRIREEKDVVSTGSNEVVGGSDEVFENKRLGIKIKGRFVGGYLDFSRPVRFKGCYVKEQEFIFSGSSSGKIKISEGDLSSVERIREIDGRLSLLSSKEKSSIIFCDKFVYKGAVDGNGNPNGSGVMIKSTGESLEGGFSPDDLGKWLQ